MQEGLIMVHKTKNKFTVMYQAYHLCARRRFKTFESRKDAEKFRLDVGEHKYSEGLY